MLTNTIYAESCRLVCNKEGLALVVFQFEACVVPVGLMKFLFASDVLSVSLSRCIADCRLLLWRAGNTRELTAQF